MKIRLNKRSGATWSECKYESLEWEWEWKNIPAVGEQLRDPVKRKVFTEKKMNDLFSVAERFGKVTRITLSIPGSDHKEVDFPRSFSDVVLPELHPDGIWIYVEPYGEDVAETIQAIQIQPAASINLDMTFSGSIANGPSVTLFMDTEFFMNFTNGNRVDNRKVFERNAINLENFLATLEDQLELQLVRFNRMDNFISPYRLEVKPELLG
jgi:hypothetical protein